MQSLSVKGVATPAKTDRNTQLWFDWWKRDLTQAQLVAKYNISMARVYEIIRPFRIKYPDGPTKDFELPDRDFKEEERVRGLTSIPNFDQLDAEGEE